jgi:hypothetical protein
MATGNRCTDLVAKIRKRTDAQQSRYGFRWNQILRDRRDLLAEVDRLRGLVWRMQTHVAAPAPCRICGYNGEGFWQPETHACAKLGSTGNG